MRLIAPQFVKPFVKSNKNDAADAEAICEAAQRPNMRFVAVKAVEQKDIQALHRMRSLAVERRTSQINQIRGLLLEYGIEVGQGRPALQRRLPEILEDANNGQSARFRAELQGLAEELQHLNERVAHYDAQIDAIAQGDRQARKQDRTSRWATALKRRRHSNVAVVAMANKIARVAYAVMTTGKPYDPAMGALANG